MTNLALPDNTSKILSLHTAQGSGEIAAVINAMSGDLTMQKTVELAITRNAAGESIQPNINKLIAQKDGIAQVNSVVKACLHRFILMNFQNSEEATQEIVYDFQNEILQNRKDFTLFDLLYFFKYIRINSGKRTDTKDFRVYGNTLTYLKLSEFFGYYLEDRCIEMEIQLARKQDAENKSMMRDKAEKFVVWQSENLFVKVEMKGKVRCLSDCDEKDATEMDWELAYRVFTWIKTNTEASPSIRVKGEKKQSIIEYIRQQIPTFFDAKKIEKPSAEKLDEKRMAQILDFIDKCDEMDKKEKQKIRRDVEERKKMWQERKKKEEELLEKFTKPK